MDHGANIEAFHNGAFSKTVGDRLDPLQLLGIITVFRGGPTLIARPGVDIKIDKTTGLVQPGRGSRGLAELTRSNHCQKS
jgi:hypothetical protein